MNILSFILITSIFELIIYLCASFVSIKKSLLYFQQNRYELYRYSKWLFDFKRFKFPLLEIVFCVLIFLSGFIRSYVGYLVDIGLVIIYAIISIIKESKVEYIKDLVVTSRVIRQIIFFVLIMIIFLLDSILMFNAFVSFIIAILLPYLVIYLVAILTYPIEELIKKAYENKAKRILNENNNLIKIGITGSFGKTSTKNIVNDIISNSFYTLITPASYNTPMGITKTIRQMLKPIHEVFVCEMGADHKNDIKHLMNFVCPKYGIVTSIGEQHLNTFKSLDNIINEKMKEIEMLPSDGVGFINLDNEYIANYKIKNNCKIVSVGIENKEAQYVAKNIKYTNEGMEFSLKIKSKVYKFKTKLLGKHNITNILIGIALAIELGIDINDIVKAVSGINQVEHRLEVKKINNYTFIDDAFNSNPVGSKMALDVLSLMSGKRVIVTPGMIDEGAKQDELNREFGMYMKDRADFVILVGKVQTQAINEGLIASKFNSKNIKVVDNVKEAFNFIYSKFSTKDTILLENDLPDAFNM